jgi:hypothetical protein
MITSLTEEQVAALDKYRDAGLARGMSCERIKRDTFLGKIDRFYTEILSREKPIVTIFMPSPVAAWAAVCWLASFVDETPAEEFRTRALGVQDLGWPEMQKRAGDTMLSLVWPYSDMQFWAGYISYYEYMREVLGVKPYPETWDLFKSLDEACLIYPLEKFCVISERQTSLHMEEGRLHCDDGPATAYADGFEVYAIHGVRVPKNVVMAPEKQTLEEIEADGNAESKRVRIERFGWERYLKDSGAAVVDQRHNDRDAQDEVLYRLRDGTQRFAFVDPSTGRRYALGVPREIQNCEQAQMWMSHLLDRYAIHRS